MKGDCLAQPALQHSPTCLMCIFVEVSLRLYNTSTFLATSCDLGQRFPPVQMQLCAFRAEACSSADTSYVELRPFQEHIEWSIAGLDVKAVDIYACCAAMGMTHLNAELCCRASWVVC